MIHIDVIFHTCIHTIIYNGVQYPPPPPPNPNSRFSVATNLVSAKGIAHALDGPFGQDDTDYVPWPVRRLELDL